MYVVECVVRCILYGQTSALVVCTVRRAGNLIIFIRKLNHNICNLNKLEHRRTAHLLNFVYHRSNDERYTQIGPRNLRRYNAAVLRETKANNKSFERSILYYGDIVRNDLVKAK